MKFINLSENKTLKLQNVLSISFIIDNDELPDFNVEVEKMNSTIRAHGARQIGPLVQYSSIGIGENDEKIIKHTLMLQSDVFLHNIQKPYRMDSVIQVKNCLYARYNGPDAYIKYAYDKIGVYAFENDYELDGSNYTIYVSENEDEDTTMVDVFMPVKN